MDWSVDFEHLFYRMDLLIPIQITLQLSKEQFFSSLFDVDPQFNSCFHFYLFDSLFKNFKSNLISTKIEGYS